ncbi:hypothetical protein TREMEDRAFT_62942 [Tremella mesenterica DSM 1558]|uniref:uncharacterized protein n=1 Tax=Tremella mesenterica (strain ATCC 24925 / CBS 8224 / DSM 1558 / NBRC 9311 / NRRL Y-6157 / RJB 2259-6 / UBC 559-6) TaxID=578456 RepID=UPI0003F49C52|nr:uncharacterized protein TREMEDRAFT_62942 [Tremella mesenterica DSM 1558]EIW69213.1 hypothetical protein TREMEDRAFT_62942 [Tremella mesenterica DSM 1558]
MSSQPPTTSSSIPDDPLSSESQFIHSQASADIRTASVDPNRATASAPHAIQQSSAGITVSSAPGATQYLSGTDHSHYPPSQSSARQDPNSAMVIRQIPNIAIGGQTETSHIPQCWSDADPANRQASVVGAITLLVIFALSLYAVGSPNESIVPETPGDGDGDGNGYVSNVASSFGRN